MLVGSGIPCSPSKTVRESNDTSSSEIPCSPSKTVRESNDTSSSAIPCSPSQCPTLFLGSQWGDSLESLASPRDG